MKYSRSILFILIFQCILGCTTNPLISATPADQMQVTDDALWYRDFVRSGSGQVEVLAAYKKGLQQPTILIIHGHQADDDERPFMRRSMGALWFSPKRLRDQVDKGYAVVSMSLPGYGASSGPADFCGPQSKRSIHSVLKWIRTQRWADPKKIGVYGVSRGAILAALIAEEDPNLAAVVLSSGSYDLEEDFKDPNLSGIRKNMESEIRPSVNAVTLKERSAISRAQLIQSPILILHGTDDPKGKIETVKNFVSEISKTNPAVFFKEFKGRGHFLDKFEEQKEVHEFCHQYLHTSTPGFTIH